MVVLCRAWRSLALWILLSAVLLAACSPPAPRDRFAYTAEPFSLSVEGTYLPANDPDGIPRPVAAEVTAGAPVNGDPTLRSLTVTFTAPSSLCGVTVAATMSPAADGTVGRSVVFTYPSDYGEVKATAKGDELDGLLRFAEALLPMGDVVGISPADRDGSCTVIRRTGDGGREAVFVFAEGAVFPSEVILTDERGRVELAVAEKRDG